MGYLTENRYPIVKCPNCESRLYVGESPCSVCGVEMVWDLHDKVISEESKKNADLLFIANSRLEKSAMAMSQRITEIEAQIPKVVKPNCVLRISKNLHLIGICDCGSNLAGYMMFCPNCGSKLNWPEEK